MFLWLVCVLPIKLWQLKTFYTKNKQDGIYAETGCFFYVCFALDWEVGVLCPVTLNMDI